MSCPCLSTLISNVMIGAHPPGTPPMKRGWFVLTARKLLNSELLLATCLPSTKSLPVSASFSARRECHRPSHTLEPVVGVYSTMTALGPLSNKNRTCNKVDVSHLPNRVCFTRSRDDHQCIARRHLWMGLQGNQAINTV